MIDWSRLLIRTDRPDTREMLAGWEWLSGHRTATAAAYAKAMSMPARTAQNHLKRLAELGLVRKRGAARATVYEVRR